MHGHVGRSVLIYLSQVVKAVVEKKGADFLKTAVSDPGAVPVKCVAKLLGHKVRPTIISTSMPRSPTAVCADTNHPRETKITKIVPTHSDL